MNHKFFSSLILFLYVSISMAQSDLDAYKYVIIPKKYDFLKEENKYRLNELTKFLFEKQGYRTLVEDEDYPADLMKNLCLALTANVKNESSMFTSKLVVELSNCYNKVVFTSAEGRSKEKDYQKSYNQALRNAFVSLEEIPYNFNEDLIINNQINKAASSSAVTSPVVTTSPVVPVSPEVPEVREQVVSKEAKESFLAKSYQNSNISFILIEQNNSLVAYIKESKIEAYQMGEKIGMLSKTSRPDTYRVTWKAKDGKSYKTTGYFDQQGDLNIDMEKDGEIQVLVFKEVK